MTILTINGLKLNYEILRASNLAPDEPRETLVLVHGIVIDNLASYYLTIAPAIAAAGIDVIMFDHRGHGKSERIKSGYQMEHILDDIAELLDTIHDGTPVHIAGNSYGGTIAYGFALKFPERVASLGSLEAEPPTAFWANEMVQAFEESYAEMRRPDAMVRMLASFGMPGVKMLKTANGWPRTPISSKNCPKPSWSPTMRSPDWRCRSWRSTAVNSNWSNRSPRSGS